MKSDSFSKNISIGAAFGARLAFAMTIVLAPLRARYVLFERPTPPVYMDFTDFLVFGSDISILVLLALWLISAILMPRPIKLGPKFIWIPMLCLYLAGSLSLFSSLDAALSLYHLIRLIILFLFYLYVVNEIHSPVLVIISVAIQVITQSIFAIEQFLLQHSISLKTLGEHELDPAVRGVSIVSDGSIRLLRAYGLAEHPNILGGCLAFSLIVLLATYLFGSTKTRGILMIIFLLGFFALLTTFSRSAWFAFIAGSVLLLGIQGISIGWLRLQLLVWLGLASILVTIPFFWNYKDFIVARFNYEDSFAKIPTETQSILGRQMLNETAFRIFLMDPLKGVGLGSAALAIGKQHPEFPGYAVPPHFSLLAVALETGILGAVAYSGLLLLPWLVLARKKINLIQKPLLTTASALLLAISLVGLFDIYPWLPPTGRLWHWLIWGLWSAAYEMKA